MLKPIETLAAVEAAAEAKASASSKKLLILGAMAGAFIALAGLASTFVTAWMPMRSDFYGIAKLLGGVVFSAGLVMVVLGGAELFTGNSLMIAGVLSHKIKISKMLRNWGLVYLGNFIGALLVVLAAWGGGVFASSGGTVGTMLGVIAVNKIHIKFFPAILLGILCNFLVCMAVWLAFSAKTLQGKVLGIIFPITVFIICGFEHSIANMFYIPAGWLAAGCFDIWMIFANLIPVTLGNIIGGGLFVAAAYHFALNDGKISLCLVKNNQKASNRKLQQKSLSQPKK